MLKRIFTACFISLFIASYCMAAEYPLPDPDEEARAYALFHQVRCSVCESNSLADSPSDTAAELRQIIRKRVAAGDTDGQVKEYLLAQYGDKVKIWYTMRPIDVAMSYGPLVLLAGLFIIAWFYLRRENRPDSAKK